MTPKSPKKLKHSDITSLIDGKDLGDMTELWKDTAESDARLYMIAELKNKNVGFNEIEQFGLGLKYSFKSEKMQERSEKPKRPSLVLLDSLLQEVCISWITAAGSPNFIQG